MLWDSIRRNSAYNVNVILGAHFPVNAQLNELGMASLHFAAGTSNKEVMEVILSHMPDVNIRDKVR